MTSLQSDLENNQLKSNHVCSLICPTFDYLINEKIITNVSCLVPNCDETFPSQSCLNFHLSKVHRINNQTSQTNEILLTRAKSKSQKLEDNCNCKYYCPVQKCKFYIGSQCYLPTYHSLKNHFIRMHGKKSYNCLKCNKIFAIKSEMRRHADNCGIIFKCPTCECPYASKSSLLKHIRKKNHDLMIQSEQKKPNQILIKSSQIEDKSSKQNVRIAPLVIDQPKQQPSSSPIILIQIDSNNYLDYNQRSFGCQTQFTTTTTTTNSNNTNITQETASQTTQFQSSNYCETLQIYPTLLSNSTSTSTDNTNCFNINQETQTLNRSSSILTSDEEYMNMLLSDISTQTQINEFPTYEANNNQTETFKSCSIQTSQVSLNTAFTQTSNIGISNLELSNLDDEIYFNNVEEESNNFATTSTHDNNQQQQQEQNYYESNNFDYPSSSYACQTCQTDDYFLLNTTNTNSIQTQTTHNIYYNNPNDSRYIDTITQTDWNLID